MAKHHRGAQTPVTRPGGSRHGYAAPRRSRLGAGEGARGLREEPGARRLGVGTVGLPSATASAREGAVPLARTYTVVGASRRERGRGESPAGKTWTEEGDQLFPSPGSAAATAAQHRGISAPSCPVLPGLSPGTGDAGSGAWPGCRSPSSRYNPAAKSLGRSHRIPRSHLGQRRRSETYDRFPLALTCLPAFKVKTGLRRRF